MRKNITRTFISLLYCILTCLIPLHNCWTTFSPRFFCASCPGCLPVGTVPFSARYPCVSRRFLCHISYFSGLVFSRTCNLCQYGTSCSTMLIQSLGMNCLLQFSMKQSHTHLNGAMWSVSQSPGSLVVQLYDPADIFWSPDPQGGLVNGISQQIHQQLLQSYIPAIRPPCKESQTHRGHELFFLLMLLHCFSFAVAVLRPSMLVCFRTSSRVLSLTNISQASFGETALDPGLGPGQLLRML